MLGGTVNLNGWNAGLVVGNSNGTGIAKLYGGTLNVTGYGGGKEGEIDVGYNSKGTLLLGDPSGNVTTVNEISYGAGLYIFSNGLVRGYGTIAFSGDSSISATRVSRFCA